MLGFSLAKTSLIFLLALAPEQLVANAVPSSLLSSDGCLEVVNGPDLCFFGSFQTRRELLMAEELAKGWVDAGLARDSRARTALSDKKTVVSKQECFENAIQWSAGTAAAAWEGLGRVIFDKNGKTGTATFTLLGQAVRYTVKKLYERAVYLDKKSHTAWYFLGHEMGGFIQQGSRFSKLDCLEKAVQLQPNEARYWSGWVSSALASAKVERGSLVLKIDGVDGKTTWNIKECLEKALALDPKDGLAWSNLASYLADAPSSISKKNNKNDVNDSYAVTIGGVLYQSPGPALAKALQLNKNGDKAAAKAFDKVCKSGGLLGGSNYCRDMRERGTGRSQYTTKEASRVIAVHDHSQNGGTCWLSSWVAIAEANIDACARVGPTLRSELWSAVGLDFIAKKNQGALNLQQVWWKAIKGANCNAESFNSQNQSSLCQCLRHHVFDSVVFSENLETKIFEKLPRCTDNLAMLREQGDLVPFADPEFGKVEGRIFCSAAGDVSLQSGRRRLSGEAVRQEKINGGPLRGPLYFGTPSWSGLYRGEANNSSSDGHVVVGACGYSLKIGERAKNFVRIKNSHGGSGDFGKWVDASLESLIKNKNLDDVTELKDPVKDKVDRTRMRAQDKAVQEFFRELDKSTKKTRQFEAPTPNSPKFQKDHRRAVLSLQLDPNSASNWFILGYTGGARGLKLAAENLLHQNCPGLVAGKTDFSPQECDEISATLNPKDARTWWNLFVAINSKRGRSSSLSGRPTRALSCDRQGQVFVAGKCFSGEDCLREVLKVNPRHEKALKAKEEYKAQGRTV